MDIPECPCLAVRYGSAEFVCVLDQLITFVMQRKDSHHCFARGLSIDIESFPQARPAPFFGIGQPQTNHLGITGGVSMRPGTQVHILLNLGEQLIGEPKSMLFTKIELLLQFIVFLLQRLAALTLGSS